MTASLIDAPTSLNTEYLRVRNNTEQLAEPYSEADQTVQSMTDASPVKWHLAHTTWFFETFLLKPNLADYQPFNEQFEYLFNSYYNSVGQQYPRANRGLITRPGKDEVLAYRSHVDKAMQALFQSAEYALIEPLVTLGLAHEQQHQELLVTDVQHAMSFNPLHPQITEVPPAYGEPATLGWYKLGEGIYDIGNNDDAFCFDNETPQHKHYIHAFSLADRLITNREYLQFMRDGGYENPLLWLSEGWAWKQLQQIDCPLYWQFHDRQWSQLSLAGCVPLDMNAPVRHVSFFEAAAFALWSGSRLPTEFEWEVASRLNHQVPDLVEHRFLQPIPGHIDQQPFKQLFNTLWQWTGSQYLPYPGFKAPNGAVGEYNGKFMSNQFVLRGGSAVTPNGHIRASYRNFFPAHTRWQFTGIRIAKDD
ncbi:MAG: ergothioneine biosynthesis protein EgtB [Reinekea sp.]